MSMPGRRCPTTTISWSKLKSGPWPQPGSRSPIDQLFESHRDGGWLTDQLWGKGPGKKKGFLIAGLRILTRETRERRTGDTERRIFVFSGKTPEKAKKPVASRTRQRAPQAGNFLKKSESRFLENFYGPFSVHAVFFRVSRVKIFCQLPFKQKKFKKL